jgi:hypothetical protein
MLRDFKQVNAHRHDPFSNFLREIHEPDQTGVPFDVFFTFPKQVKEFLVNLRIFYENF